MLTSGLFVWAVRTSDLDLKNLNCTYTRLKYDDPHYLGVRRDVLVIRGPTSFEDREAIFLHFELEDESRDFFTVSYFVFPGWDKFNGRWVSPKGYAEYGGMGGGGVMVLNRVWQLIIK